MADSEKPKTGEPYTPGTEDFTPIEAELVRRALQRPWVLDSEDERLVRHLRGKVLLEQFTRSRGYR